LTLAAALPTVARADDSASRWQPPEAIAAAARAAAEAAGVGEVQAVAVDERLKLNRCTAPLDARVERAFSRGAGTIAVSCSAPTPWRLFVPVRAVDDIAVVVLARNVQPGETLTTDDVAVARRPSTALPYDYLSDTAQAVGLTMRRTQPAGAVVTAAALEAPEVVRRGELVTISSGAGPISVKSEGVALEAARRNQRVKVRSSSGRVIEGTAEGPGQVRVGSYVTCGLKFACSESISDQRRLAPEMRYDREDQRPRL
jgi:flagella basal body P-ring formation protein FlgA